MDFVATQDFVTPYVVATGMPHKPTRICKKHFKKGDIIQGEIKTVKGKPSFVLHKGVMVIPFSVIEQIVTKKIAFSGADGVVSKDNPVVKLAPIKNTNQKKINYIDSGVIGAVLGFAGVMIAEKQGWIGEANSKNRIYGALAGGLFAMYLVYRKNNA
jgi:hypothetical protein